MLILCAGHCRRQPSDIGLQRARSKLLPAEGTSAPDGPGRGDPAGRPGSLCGQALPVRSDEQAGQVEDDHPTAVSSGLVA